MNTKVKTKSETASKKSEKTSPQKIQIREGTNLKEFADIIGVRSKDLIEGLQNRGFTATINTNIDENLADIISQDIKSEIEITTIEELVRAEAESQASEMVEKPPVVTIMGHVDHGKTTLLDAIRESNLVNKEAGGITQHIGAYRIVHHDRPITFIDTPGHEAFTKLRARGAKSTDIVILIVAADDGVMPQTKEAIGHAKAAEVPIIVAINKMDRPEADAERVKQQLSKEGLLVENWGGEVVCIEISAKEKTNLNELLEMILLVSEMTEHKGNPNVPTQGFILEARLDSQKGPMATVIIQHGNLELGAAFISGKNFGKVKALFDEHGKVMKKAGLSMPVEILGFSDVPNAGDLFQVVPDLETAKRIAQYRLEKTQAKKIVKKESLTLDQLFKNIEEGEIKELSLIIKADVHGSVEVLKDVLPNLSSDQVKIKIILAATGIIAESDIHLASASNAIILGYNTKPTPVILDFAKKENVEIRSYDVIYHLTEDIKKAMTGLLEPVIKENYLGRAEIRKIFTIPRTGQIAGCLVLDGKIIRNAQIRIIRGDESIHQGRISSLKHLKNNVTEVKRDYECGIGIEGFKEIREGDIIEAFMTEKVMPE